MGKPYLSLQPSEGIVVQAAATIYAGYLAGGLVVQGREDEFLKRSIQEAIRIARVTDDNLQADEEVM